MPAMRLALAALLAMEQMMDKTVGVALVESRSPSPPRSAHSRPAQGVCRDQVSDPHPEPEAAQTISVIVFRGYWAG